MSVYFKYRFVNYLCQHIFCNLPTFCIELALAVCYDDFEKRRKGGSR
nr:MAG TPA: hypothetical protein [Caudoviricetes sp.]